MLDLLKQEIDTQSEKIIPLIDTIESADDISDHYESLINSTRAIKGAINLVHVDIAVSIVELLESVFSLFQSRQFIAEDKHKKTFKQAIDILKTISALSAEQIEMPELEIINSISLCSEQLAELLSIDLSSSGSSTDTASDPHQHSISSFDNQPFSTAENIDPHMFSLFISELDNCLHTMTDSLLEIEEDNASDALYESMMRAAHSIKGAARMIGIDAAVKLSHAMEDVFVATQEHRIKLDKPAIDHILLCTDILASLKKQAVAEISQWTEHNSQLINRYIHDLQCIQDARPPKSAQPSATEISAPQSTTEPTVSNTDNMVRVSTQRINKLVNLAGELSVSSNWMQQYTDSMRLLKRKHTDLLEQIDQLRSAIENTHQTDLQQRLITNIQHSAEQFRENLTEQLLSLDDFDRRSSSLTSQINHEIIASRMRPFSDITQAYKRMVRDISHALGKKVKLQITGEDTAIDRDILEKLEAPLNHIIRNAIDHGIETPEERLSRGKSESGLIQINVLQQGGRLGIQIRDDGRGVDIESLRQKILEKKLVNEAMADQLSKTELLDFLFLPSFSTRSDVTELSGRGVGLDIVHSTLQQVRGKLFADTELHKGMVINMELPLSLSIIRSLLVSLNNELYAFPLARIQNIVKIHQNDISSLEDKQYISIDDKHIGLIHCAQILGLPQQPPDDIELPIIIIGDWNISYGLVVDRLIGERGLALRSLNKKLGKIKDISAAAITDTGEPVLLFDTDDLLQSIHDIISEKDLYKVGISEDADSTRKRILVVDDSLTVREIEKKLLQSRGYLVDIAIDGVDGWNSVRGGNYDLVISDIDMPRMNGIEMIRMIKNDAALHSLPVMLVSYKDRPEDKQLGMQAGADYYLTKGSFHDDTLLDAVYDLIGD